MSPRAVRIADGEDASAWVEALWSDTWLEDSTLIKQDGDVTVRRANLLGRDVVIKRWALRRPKRRLQALFNSTPACRHWRGASLLMQAGIPTPRTFAILRGVDAIGPCELLVMELVPGKTLIQTIADGAMSVRQEHRLADAVGRQIEELLISGLENRDHKASNVMVLRAPSADPPAAMERVDWLSVLDCEGVRPVRRAFQAEFALFVECLGSGVPPRRSLRLRVLTGARDRYAEEFERWKRDSPDEQYADEAALAESRRTVIRNAWRDVAARLQSHGDPTPKVNPLNPNPDRQHDS